MATLRIRAMAEADGELHLRGLPIQKGEQAEVIVLTGDSVDALILAALARDPAWSWLHDEAEDIYTEEDVR